MSSHRSNSGFSLIEMMVAIVLGLIVVGSLIAFVVSSVTSYSDNSRLTRLTQDLRTGMNIVVREVRRSGYDSAAVTRALTSTNPSNYVAVNTSGSCVTYTYDRGAAATESRGFRLNAATGTLQMKVAAAAIACNSTAGWEDISDPNVVQITKFTPTLMSESICRNLDPYTDATGTARKPLGSGTFRTLAVCIKGRLRADATVERYVVDMVRVRGDDVVFNVLSQVGCPAPPPGVVTVVKPNWAAAFPPTVAEMNQECSNP